MIYREDTAQRQSTKSVSRGTAHQQPSISPPRVSLSAEQLSTGDQSATCDEMQEKQFRATRAIKLACVAISLIILAAAIDATSLSIALPIVTQRLKGTAIQAFWTGTSYLVTSGVMQPVIGGLSHVFGRKEMVLISCAFFFVGSLICALSNDFTMM